MMIYTTQEQCELFHSKYHGVGEMLICSADALLRTRNDGGYDKKHTDYLEPIRMKTLVMERTEDCGPGWWVVVKMVG